MAAEKMNTEQVALGDSSLPTIFSMIAPLDPVFPVVGDAGEAAWGAMVWYPPCPHTQQEVLLSPQPLGLAPLALLVQHSSSRLGKASPRAPRLNLAFFPPLICAEIIWEGCSQAGCPPPRISPSHRVMIPMLGVDWSFFPPALPGANAVPGWPGLLAGGDRHQLHAEIVLHHPGQAAQQLLAG